MKQQVRIDFKNNNIIIISVHIFLRISNLAIINKLTTNALYL